MAADLLAGLADATLASSLAILLVLALRRPLRRLAGPAVACAAWAVVPLATLAACLPALPAGPLPVVLAPVFALPDAALAFDAGARAAGVDAAPWLLAAWALGAGLAAVLFVQRQRRFRDRVARGEDIAGPAVVGLWRPRILLPADFHRRYSAEEQALVLEHERQHLRRGDLPALALCAALRALFWFNPLVHLAAARLRQDQELACDAAVLARHPHRRRAYGEAMLKTDLADVGAPVGCHWQSCQSLKERLMMLKQNPPGPARRRLGRALGAATAAAATVATWAGPSGAPPSAPPHVQQVTGVDVLTAPKYPKAAAEAGIEGKVMLKVFVGDDGRVQQAEIVSATPAGVFDEAALAAAREWWFSDGSRTSTGEPVRGWVQIPVWFSPDEEAPPADDEPPPAEA